MSHLLFVFQGTKDIGQNALEDVWKNVCRNLRPVWLLIPTSSPGFHETARPRVVTCVLDVFVNQFRCSIFNIFFYLERLESVHGPNGALQLVVSVGFPGRHAPSPPLQPRALIFNPGPHELLHVDQSPHSSHSLSLGLIDSGITKSM